MHVLTQFSSSLRVGVMTVFLKFSTGEITMLKSIRSVFAAAGAALALLASPPVLAQHSDIEVAVQAGKIVVDPLGEAATASNGYKIFEGDFGDLALGPNGTKNPGWADAHDLPSSGFASGNILYVRLLETLSFWDGVMWSAPALTTTTFTIVDALGSLLKVNSTGVTMPSGAGAIDQFGPGGTLHQHLDFLINAAAPTGAYRVTAQHWAEDFFGGSPAYIDSDPFYMVFNRGLSAASFEASVDALTVAPVPEPEIYALMAAGLGMMGFVARRRRGRAALAA